MGISNLVDTLTDIKNMVDNMNENLKIFAKNQEFLIGGLQQVNGKNRGNHQNSQLSCCDVKDLSGILVNNNDNDVILGKKNGRSGRITDDKIDARHLFDEMSMNKILRNDGTVQEYYDKFNLLFGDKGFDEWYLVDLFLWRLHPDIKKRISFFKPKSLSDAYCLAKCQEAANNIIKKKSNFNIPMSSCSKISKGVEKENNELAGYHECCEENVGVLDMVLANNNKGLVVMDKVCNEDGKGNDLESNESSKMDVDGVVNCEEDGKYHEIESSRVVNNNIGLNDLVEFSKEGDKDGKMASKDCISHQSIRSNKNATPDTTYKKVHHKNYKHHEEYDKDSKITACITYYKYRGISTNT